MPEKKFIVKTIIIEYYCKKKCGGLLIHTGEIVFEDHIPKFTHECIKCKKIKYFKNEYPRFEYEKLNPKEILDKLKN